MSANKTQFPVPPPVTNIDYTGAIRGSCFRPGCVCIGFLRFCSPDPAVFPCTFQNLSCCHECGCRPAFHFLLGSPNSLPLTPMNTPNQPQPAPHPQQFNANNFQQPVVPQPRYYPAPSSQPSTRYLQLTDTNDCPQPIPVPSAFLPIRPALPTGSAMKPLDPSAYQIIPNIPKLVSNNDQAVTHLPVTSPVYTVASSPSSSKASSSASSDDMAETSSSVADDDVAMCEANNSNRPPSMQSMASTATTSLPMSFDHEDEQMLQPSSPSASLNQVQNYRNLLHVCRHCSTFTSTTTHSYLAHLAEKHPEVLVSGTFCEKCPSCGGLIFSRSSMTTHLRKCRRVVSGSGSVDEDEGDDGYSNSRCTDDEDGENLADDEADTQVCEPIVDAAVLKVARYLFKNFDKLRRQYYKNKTIVHRCSKCSSEADMLFMFLQHMDMHDGECHERCPLCGFNAFSRGCYRAHFRSCFRQFQNFASNKPLEPTDVSITEKINGE